MLGVAKPSEESGCQGPKSLKEKDLFGRNFEILHSTLCIMHDVYVMTLQDTSIY